MKLAKTSIFSAIMIAVVGIGSATAHAAPAPTSPDGQIRYHTSLSNDGRAVDTTVDAGEFRIASTGQSVDLVDNAGATVVSIPLAYSVDGATYPITPIIGDGGRHLTLAPQPAAGPADKQAKFDNMLQQIGAGWANGGAMSTAIGAALGFAIGCVSIFPNFVSGCLLGLAIGTTAGAVVGTVNGNPQVQPAVFEYFTTP